jgi:16S rRNA (guanine966-N2)-methyltransferase
MSAMGGRFDGLHLLDLFSGSGALGLEALSRGAEHVVFVENARSALAAIEANVAALDAAGCCSMVGDDVFRYLARSPASVDLAVADPPYGAGSAQRLVALYLDAPFANELWLEHPWREPFDLPAGARTRRYGDTAITTLTTEP